MDLRKRIEALETTELAADQLFIILASPEGEIDEASCEELTPEQWLEKHNPTYLGTRHGT